MAQGQQRKPLEKDKNLLKTWHLLALLTLAVVFFVFQRFSRDYFWAIESHWVILMSGVVSLAIGFYEKTKRKLHERLFYLLAVLIFFFAGFQAWQDEYSKTHPGVTISIDEVGVGDDPTSHCAKVYVIADVANRGAPTILDEWLLEIQIPEEPKMTVTPFYIDPDKPMEMNEPMTGEPSFKLDSADALYNKTKPEPVRTGSKVPGILAFVVPGKTRDQLRIKGAIFSLSCKSVYGDVIRASVAWTGISAMHQYVPGMKPPPH
jgi:hypothetical protein